MRRKKSGYFKINQGEALPIKASVKRRAHFSEVDIMGIVWHGRYTQYFEEVSALLCKKSGMSYLDFYESSLRAPIVQLHIDYHNSIILDEEFIIEGSMIWTEGARINTEYRIIKSDGKIAATGYTVQMFTSALNGEVFLVSPELFERCRKRWKNGELYE